ncbi:10362_t:CDS:1, partial [Cetraspora pellucida]
QEDKNLFFNLWTEVITKKNPAAYVALTAEVEVQPSTMQINTYLTSSEKKIA